MKSLLTLFLLAVFALNAKDLGMINPTQFQCALSLEVSPLEYIFVTRAMSVRIRLTSNCLRLRDFVFETFFTFKTRLSMKKHPTIVELKIFNNKYRLAYTGRVQADTNTIMRKYRYTKVSLSPSKRPSARNVDATAFNRLFLDEQKPGSFGVRRLNNLLYRNNPVRCNMDRGMKKMMCNLK